MQNENARFKKVLKLLDPVFVFFCDTEHNMDHDPNLKQYFLDAKECLKEAMDLLIPMQNDEECNHIIGLDCDYEGGIPRQLSAGLPSGRNLDFFEYYNYCPECGVKNPLPSPKADE